MFDSDMCARGFDLSRPLSHEEAHRLEMLVHQHPQLDYLQPDHNYSSFVIRMTSHTCWPSSGANIEVLVKQFLDGLENMSYKLSVPKLQNLPRAA